MELNNTSVAVILMRTDMPNLLGDVRCYVATQVPYQDDRLPARADILLIFRVIRSVGHVSLV
jgi:hypothetical protein